MRRRAGRMALLLAAGAAIAGCVSGCGQREGSGTAVPAPVVETHTEIVQTEALAETEPETRKVIVRETEPPKLVTSVDYTSKDGTIKITLPDNTWKIGQDADEMRVFQSGKDAMINIVHANTETAMSSLNVMRSQQELEESLTSQYSDPNAFRVVSFVDAPVNDVHVYRYVVKYNAAARMWAYSVTNAIVAADQAYVVVGSITEDNEKLLEAVQKSVESFRVLKDEKLRAVTGEVITGKIQKTSETVRTDTDSSDELKSLAVYGASTTLVSVDDVNVRLSPGTDAEILTMTSKNDAVTVTGETANWFQVNIGGNTGYIRKDFLVYGNAQQTEKQSETTSETTASTDPYSSTADAEMGNAMNYGTSSTLYATSDVNVRSQPGTDSAVTGSLGTGNSVTVIGETDNWFIVSVNGTTGYVSKAYLTADSTAAAPAETTAQTDTAATPETTADNTGADTGNTGEQNNGTGTDTSAADGSGMSTVSGVIVGTTPDSLTIQGDDGNTYSVYYGDANINSTDGIYDGVYVQVGLDSTQAASDGTLYATNVEGS